MPLGGAFWVLVAIVFWAMVFSIVLFLVHYVSSGRDDEEIVCELDDTYFANEQRSTSTPILT